jgi:multidrug efflux system membrane fusion protein
VITQLQPITAVFTLPEDQLPTVAKQMRKGTLEVDAYSRDDQSKLASGKLLTIDNQIDQTTGTGRLKAVFDNEDSVLWPNQFVNIHLLLETRKNATVIPAAAVQQGPQGTYVYVVKPDKTVEARNVGIALTEGTSALVTNGVSVNDTVVTDGQDKLRNGSSVEAHAAPSYPNGDDSANGAGQHNPGDKSYSGKSAENHARGQSKRQTGAGGADAANKGNPSR